jgi:TPR repeat protein
MGLIFCGGMQVAKDPAKAVKDYIKALEDMNDSLLENLKLCVMLLENFSDIVVDKQGWREMLDMFWETIAVAESESRPETLH